MQAYFFLRAGRKKEELYSEIKDTNLPFSIHGVIKFKARFVQQIYRGKE